MTNDPIFPHVEGPASPNPELWTPEGSGESAAAAIAAAPAMSPDGFGIQQFFKINPTNFIVTDPQAVPDPVNTDKISLINLTNRAMAVQMYPGATLGVSTVFTGNDVRLADFIMPVSARVVGLLIPTTQNPTGTSTFDFGIYDKNASQLLAHTGIVSPQALNATPPNWQLWTFQTPVNLSSGERYKFGYFLNLNTGSWTYIPIIQVADVRLMYLEGINTNLQYARRVTQVRIPNTGWTQLLNDPGGVGGPNSHNDTPWTMLVTG